MAEKAYIKYYMDLWGHLYATMVDLPRQQKPGAYKQVPQHY